MAKGKKAKKVASPKTKKPKKPITVVVPDDVAGLGQKVLEGIGKMALQAGSPFNVDQVAIVKTSKAPAGTHEASPEWRANV